VVVNGGATLSGIGTIVPTQQLEARNTVAVNGGATLDPGIPVSTSSPGILTVGSAVTPGTTTAAVTMAPNSKWAFYFNNAAGPATPAALDTGGSTLTAGTTNNELVVNGNLALDMTLTFGINGDATQFTPGNTYSFLVATSTTGMSPAGSVIPSQAQFDTTNFTGYVPGSFQFSLDAVPGATNQLFFNMTPVPEPGTLALVGAAAAAGLWRWRRRRTAGR
jgi:hypothetical protein